MTGEGTGRGFPLLTSPRAYHRGELCSDASSTAWNGGSSGISSSCGSAEGPAGSSCETSPDMYWLGMKGLGRAKNGVDPAPLKVLGEHCLVCGGWCGAPPPGSTGEQSTGSTGQLRMATPGLPAWGCGGKKGCRAGCPHSTCVPGLTRGT